MAGSRDDDSSTSDLLSYFRNNQGRRIHRSLHFFEIYERHFARFRNAAPFVLEIGVNQGGGLEMWRHYFGANATIIGVDIKESCLALRDESFLIELGDQADTSFWDGFKQRHPRIDILIDDGGHTMEQQRVTFECMFPHVSADGIYLCEDLHTSYWGKYGGGYRKPGTFIEYAKMLVDELHHFSIKDENPPAPTEFTRTCDSIHFYDRMVVFQKRVRDRPRVAVSEQGKFRFVG